MTTNTDKRPGKPRGLFPRLRSRQGAPTLTDAEAAALATQVSDDPITLAPDDLACATCGRAVPGRIDPEKVEYVEPIEVEVGNGLVSRRSAPSHVEPMTVCDACTARAVLATELSNTHRPRIAVGGFIHRGKQAEAMIAGMLVALDVLGFPEPSVEDLDPHSLARAVHHLAPVTAGLTWRSRFAPLRAATTITDTASPRPWAHVRESQRIALRRAYADLMAERLSLNAPPVTIAPPKITEATLAASKPRPEAVDTGCLYCGIGSITMTAVRVTRAGGIEAAGRTHWTLRTISRSALGGTTSRAPITGYICPECSEEVDRAGGVVGALSLTRSLMAHLDLLRRWDLSVTLDGLIGWGAVVSDARRRGRAEPGPNRNRWQHLDTGNITRLFGDRRSPDSGVTNRVTNGVG